MGGAGKGLELVWNFWLNIKKFWFLKTEPFHGSMLILKWKILKRIVQIESQVSGWKQKKKKPENLNDHGTN